MDSDQIFGESLEMKFHKNKLLTTVSAIALVLAVGACSSSSDDEMAATPPATDDEMAATPPATDDEMAVTPGPATDDEMVRWFRRDCHGCCTWTDVVVGRCVGCADRLQQPDLMKCAVRTACPPTIRQRMPERFMRCVTRVLLAASTTPEPMAMPSSFRACSARCRCLRKKASSRSVSARSGAAAASRRWRSARLPWRRPGRDG